MVVEEFHVLLKRLVAAVAALQEQTDHYHLFTRAGSYDAAAQAKSLMSLCIRVAYETTEEIELLDVEPSLQEIGLLVVLGERLKESRAVLAEHVESVPLEDGLQGKKFVTIDN